MAITKKELKRARKAFLKAYSALDKKAMNFFKEQVEASGKDFVFDFREKIKELVANICPQVPTKEYDEIVSQYLQDMGFCTTWYDKYMVGHFCTILAVRAEQSQYDPNAVLIYVTLLGDDFEEEVLNLHDLETTDVWCALIDFMTEGDRTVKEWLSQVYNI